jgi:glycine/D-amino acid oxidase-like deaminating enzyme
VIGGGITGAFSAYFLALAGATVTLVSGGSIGAGASGSNAGGLNPLHGPGVPGPMEGLALRSLRLALEHWEAIGERSGIDFGGRFVARLHIALDGDAADGLQNAERLHNAAAGFSARILSGDELRRVVPSVSPEAVAALWTEGNARVDPLAYTRAVAAAAAQLGAAVVAAPARGLRRQGGRVTGVVLDSGTLECDGVVIATGPWSEAPASWLDVPIPVMPLKGELLLARPERGAPDAEVTAGTTGVYAASAGHVWLGGTEEPADFDDAPTADGRERILSAVDRLLPGLGPLRIAGHVAGLRPVTPDGRPVLGIPDGWENVCLAMGSGRKGMLLGAGLGRAAAELLTRGATELPIDACDPRRLVTSA